MTKLLIMSRRSGRHRETGSVLPLLAVGMLAIFGIVGLSIDTGHAFLNKTRLQNSLDSAALSGARTLMLSNDTAAASVDARIVFEEHLEGEMGSLDADNLILQYSDTLVPFVADGSSPRYVRAVFENYTTDMSFSSVLPSVDASMNIAGSAVAGPIPVGYSTGGETCDITPLLICGVAGDSDCSDGSCFGYQVGGHTEYEFHFKQGIETLGLEHRPNAYSLPQQSACGEGSIFYGCIPSPENSSDLGKFMLSRLDCAHISCIRENLAGSYNSCLSQNASVQSQYVASQTHILQGLMSRFGVYHVSLSSENYPPDIVVTDRTANVHYWYDNYKQDVAAVIASGSSNNRGAPYRRVVATPIVDCQAESSGPGINAVLGMGCFFLTRAVNTSHVDASLYGQFVHECEASGEQGETVPRLSTHYSGLMEIILYKDPDNDES